MATKAEDRGKIADEMAKRMLRCWSEWCARHPAELLLVKASGKFAELEDLYISAFMDGKKFAEEIATPGFIGFAPAPKKG